MGLYKRNDSPYWWMRNGSGPGISTGILREGPTPKATRENRLDAEHVFNAARVHTARVAAGLEEPYRDAITFDDWADWWVDHKLPEKKSADRDRDRLEANLRPFFRDYPLTAIDAQLVDEYVRHRAACRVGPPPRCCGERMTPAGPMFACARCRTTTVDRRRSVDNGTINREVDQLKVMLRDAVPRYLKASPIAGKKKLKVTPKPKVVLTAEEVARVAEQLTPRSRQVLFLLCVETIIRWGNAINLQRSENKSTKLALRDSKTGPYDVPLSARLRQMLAALPHRGPYYFAELRAAKLERDWRGAMRLALRRACTRAGVPYGRVHGGITFHTATRATGATLQLQAGHDLKTVQDNGNWKDLRAMQLYLQTDLKHRKAASDSVGEAIAAARAKHGSR